MSAFITPMLHNVMPFDVADGFVATFGILGGVQIQYATFTITSQTSSTPIVTKTVEFSDPMTDDIREFSYTFTPADLSALSNGNRYVMYVTTSYPSVEQPSEKSNMVLLKCYENPVFACTVDFGGTLITKSAVTISLVYSQAQGQELNYYYATLYGVKTDGSEEILSQTDREYNGADIVLQRYPMPNSSEISPYVSYKIILLGQMKGGKELTYQITGLSMRTYGINLDQSKFTATNLCDSGKIQLDGAGVVAGDYLTGQIIEVPNTYDGLLGGSLEIQGETLGGEGTPSVPIPITNVESPIEIGSYGRNIFPKMVNGATGDFGGATYSVNDGEITFNGTLDTDGASMSVPMIDENGVQNVDEMYWAKVNSNFGLNDTRNIAYGNGIWVLVGTAGSLDISSDGVTWSSQTSQLGTSEITNVKYGDGKFIAVGAGGKMSSSTNGTTWSLVSDSSFGSDIIYALNYGNNLWVAAGANGKLATSSDGITWTQQTSSFGTTTIRCLIYANNIWTAVGISGKIATSTDGATWTQQISPTVLDLFNIGYMDGLWVVVGASGRLISSSNTTDWTIRISSFLSSEPIIGISHGNGLWVIGGGNNRIAISYDGINWETMFEYLDMATQIRTIGYSNGLFIIGGLDGKLAISTSKNRVLETSKTYTLSTPTYYGSTIYPQLYLYYTDLTSEFISATSAKNSFTISKDVLALDFRIVTSDSSGSTLSNAIIAPQLESGSTQNDFIPFNSSYYSVPIKDIDNNIYTLDRLSSTIYDRIYYNMADGKWYIEKECGEVVLNGVESWTNDLTETAGLYRHFSGLINAAQCDLTHGIAKASNFQLLSTGATFRNEQGFTIISGRIYVYYQGEILATFLTWLASNPITLVYQLATPVSYELHADTVAILENLLSKNGSTYLFSTNTTMPYYNYLNFDGILTGQYLIKRRKPTETVWITLQSYTITTLSDLLFTMYDTYNASDTDYQYALVPINVDGTEGTYMAFNITSEFNGAYLCDHEKSYSIYNELKFDSFERVQNSGIIESFGARYPTIQNNATINYNKGTFTFNIMATNYTSASDINRQAEIDLREEIADFITNGRMKIIKDYNGNIWLVATYNGVTYTFMKELGNGVANATFNWVEKGDANSEEDLEKMGMLNQFEIINGVENLTMSMSVVEDFDATNIEKDFDITNIEENLV